MIKVFYAPDGFRDTTRHLFAEALKARTGRALPDYSGILYLAPNQPKTDEAQRIFHEIISRGSASGRCYVPPGITTLTGLARAVCSNHPEIRVLRGSLIPVIIFMLSGKSIGFSSLVAEFIRDVKGNYPGLDIVKIRDAFLSVFKESNIPESVSSIPLECLHILEGYQKIMKEKGLADEDDALNACAGYLSGNGYETLIIDGFYDPPLIERNILRILIRNSGQTFMSIPGAPDSLGVSESYVRFLKQEFELDEAVVPSGGKRDGVMQYCTYPDPEAEVEGLARNIKSLYVSGGHRNLEDVIVAFPELKKYSPMVERVFRRYGIPYALSLKKTFSKTRAFIDLSCLLSSVAEGYPRLKFSQFLSSSYFSRIPDAVKRLIPVVAPQSGIISGRETWLDFAAEGSDAVDMREIQASEGINLKDDMEWVFNKLSRLEEIRESATFARYADVLKSLLDELGFLDVFFAEGELLIADERKSLEEVFSFLYSLHFVYPEPTSLNRFIEALQRLADFSFIDEENPGVRVMDIADVMGLSPEYLYLGGLVDGALPRRKDMDFILPDSIKKKMGFLYLDKHIETQKFMFECIVGSAGNIHLSYPVMEGDDVFLPSAFLYSGIETKEAIPGIFSIEEFLVGDGRQPFLSFITEVSDRHGALRFAGSLKVTDIDAYRQCPRRFFIEKILRLEPLSVKEYDMEPATIGNILHTVMETLAFESFDDVERLKLRAASVIEDALSERRLDRYWKEIIRDAFIAVLHEICEVEKEIRGEGYAPAEAEKKIAGEPIEGIKLRGKIDRVDASGENVRLIDYKTGKAGLNCAQVMKGGEDLQLFLYAAMMKELGYRIDRVGVYSLKDISVKWCPSKRKLKGKEGIDDYITASLHLLKEAAGRLAKGDFRAEPMNEYNCRDCHENPFCPFIHQ